VAVKNTAAHKLCKAKSKWCAIKKCVEMKGVLAFSDDFTVKVRSAFRREGVECG